MSDELANGPRCTFHTPGPWTVHNIHQGPYVVGSDGVAIAQIVTAKRDPDFTARQEANARLIAAAPEMLTMLAECHQFASDGWMNHGMGSDMMDRIEALVVKASPP